MDMLDQDIDGRVAMDVNGEETPNQGRWEVVEVIGGLSSDRSLRPDVICTESINSEERINPDDPPQMTDGTVTYRVVQVTPEMTSEEVPAAQVVTTAATLVTGQQVTQAAIIANPFTATNGSGSPSGDGPFYVMMSPQDVLQAGQRTLAPRTHQFSPKLDGTRTARDERRRATHNEVERRRRDKINNWIVKLSKIVPDCSADHSKSGQFYSQSKGGILAKACDYIHELRSACSRLPEVTKENERLAMDIDMLRQQYEELKNENQLLKAHLQQHGITVTSLGNSS